jgi:glycosyltransferase involved in cell wall biosynthesis
VIDDGSIDTSVEIAARLLSTIPNGRIVSQRHSGVSRARALGASLVTGTYVQYLDADDLLKEGTLLARVAALERSGASVAYCDWQCLEESVEGRFVPGVVSNNVLSDRPEIDLLSHAWWPPGAVLYRRDLVEHLVRWNEELPVVQDLQFLILAASRGATFIHVNEVGLSYRVRQQSLSNRNPYAFLSDCYRNACEIERLWREIGPLDISRRDALRRVHRYLARVFADDVVCEDIYRRLQELEAPADGLAE